MKKCIITAETTCDLSPQLIEERGFKLIPITVIVGNEEFKDGVNITSEELFDYIKKTGNLPKTAALTEYEYEDFFTEVKKECDEIIHFSISSKASCTLQSAKKAAEKMDGVYVVDTKSLSTGEALLMLKASDMLESGASAKEVYENICALTEKVQTSFVIDVLDYLHKGGRCSLVALLGAKMLKLHPQIAEVDGALTVKKKYMGSLKRSLTQYITDLAAEYPEYDKTRAFVTHSPCDEQALVDEVIAKVKELFEFDEVIETEAGATVSTHCGKNTVGLLFIAK